jgi:signal peptidase I
VIPHEIPHGETPPEVDPPATPRGASSGHGGRRSGRRQRPFIVELPVLVVVSLAVTLLVRTFLVQPFYIPSGSMEDTLQVGDRVLVNKLAYRFGEIDRGDVVVFDGVDSFSAQVVVEEPASLLGRALQPLAQLLGLAPAGKDFIKRVVGVGGDRVVCCDEQGRITVNGVALDEEPYLFPDDQASLTEFDVEVPAGRLWLMGDHRSSSQDSRSLLGSPGGGMVPEDHVVGEAFSVVWPLDHLGWLSNPPTFQQPALTGGGAAP